ncbi:MAG TPA: glycoside hydrolase family 16 protein [Methylobacter sp.]
MFHKLNFAILLLSATAAFAQAPPDLSTMIQTFDYEFQWSGIGTNAWVYNYTTPTTINNEQQAYTPDACQGNNVAGVGRLRADRRMWNGMAYTSCAITTFAHFDQTYGYFIMRARIPKGQGIWPSFWMLPRSGAWPPELDIMESSGQDTNSVYMTVHFPNGAQDQTKYSSTMDLSTGYHTYALEWTPNQLIWFVDGIAEKAYTGPNIPNVPMYILANVAVGGTWPGSANASTSFPQSMDIDYIRAYQFNPAPAGAMPNPVSLDAIVIRQNGASVPYLVTAKAGDTLNIYSGAWVGSKAILSGGVYEIGICAYSGSPCFAFNVQPLGALAAYSQIGLTYNYMVPANLADGWYNVYVTVLTPGGTVTSQVATRFAVRNNLTPFIAPLTALPPPLPP